ncbi:MAG: MoaD/ThiS family protein [Thermodesulfobacteriota bacterium]
MAVIRLKAFSFLHARLNDLGIKPDSEFEVDPDLTIEELIRKIGLGASEVEGTFVNGKIQDRSTVLRDGDRVALVPPGTPGPYRYMLGIRDSS